VGRLIDIFSRSYVATSGRYDTWIRCAIDHAATNLSIFSSEWLQDSTVAHGFHRDQRDNGYLAFAETGAAGLAGFPGCCRRSVLRTFFSLHAPAVKFRLFGPVIFSIWCGELFSYSLPTLTPIGATIII